MKQQYKDLNLRVDTLRTIHTINGIIDNYLRQGYTLSVRQLYYQLVARDVIPNTEQSYKRIASVINDGRLAGLIDWDAIEDRNRDIEMMTRWDSGAAIVQAAADSYHMDMWEGQANRLFVIVEKAALAGVLQRTCRKYDVPMLAARGYPSVSIVRELVREHFVPTIYDQQAIILHLGDHDPSGIDMTRDLEERIALFSEEYVESGSFEPRVERIALSMEQIEEKKPPPNPAKATDARFADYRRKYGVESWELDALEPAYLVNLVETHVENYLDWDQWNARQEYVEGIRTKLTATAKQFTKEQDAE